MKRNFIAHEVEQSVPLLLKKEILMRLGLASYIQCGPTITPLSSVCRIPESRSTWLLADAFAHEYCVPVDSAHCPELIPHQRLSKRPFPPGPVPPVPPPPLPLSDHQSGNPMTVKHDFASWLGYNGKGCHLTSFLLFCHLLNLLLLNYF